MIENLVVMLIVCAAAWYAARRYLPAKWRGKKAAAKAAGCGGGCNTCGSCETTEVQAAAQRVIKIHRATSP